jgi:hypothetical protein
MLYALLNIVCPIRQQSSNERIHKVGLNKLFRGVDDLKFSDPNYKLVDVDHLKKFLKRNATNQRQYENPSNDCDDFSYILLGDVTKWDSDLAFGIAWVITEDGQFHALNVFVGTDKKVYFVEPQTDEVFLVPDNWDIRFVLM